MNEGGTSRTAFQIGAGLVAFQSDTRRVAIQNMSNRYEASRTPEGTRHLALRIYMHTKLVLRES